MRVTNTVAKLKITNLTVGKVMQNKVYLWGPCLNMHIKYSNLSVNICMYKVP